MPQDVGPACNTQCQPDQEHVLLQLINPDIKMHMACPGFVNTSMIRNAQKKAVRSSTLDMLNSSESGISMGAY